MAMNCAVSWPDVLLDQLDFVWARQARPRLDALSDEEYIGEPVPDSWNLRPAEEIALLRDVCLPQACT